MNCWFPNCFQTSVDVGVPVDTSTAVGVSTVADINVGASLSSAGDFCDVSIVSAAVFPPSPVPSLLLAFLLFLESLLLLASLLNLASIF